MMPTCKVFQCRKRKLNDNGLCPAHAQAENIHQLDINTKETCGKCSQGFEVLEAAMTCDYCGEWFHNKCSIKADQDFYNTFIDEQDKTANSNIKWFCDACNSIVATLLQENKNKGPCAQEKQQVTVSAPATVVAIDNFQNADLNGGIVGYTQKVCDKLMYGICTHGITGKTVIDGKACEFRHPKICKKYTRNGPHGRYGCNGFNCTLLHPMLCAESVKDRKCSKFDCKLYHLKWTERNFKKAVRKPGPHPTHSGQVPPNSVHKGPWRNNGRRGPPMYARGKSTEKSQFSFIDGGGNAWEEGCPNTGSNKHSSNDFLDPLVTKLRSEMDFRFSQLETLIKERFQTSPTPPKEGYPRWGQPTNPHPRCWY